MQSTLITYLLTENISLYSILSNRAITEITATIYTQTYRSFTQIYYTECHLIYRYRVERRAV